MITKRCKNVLRSLQDLNARFSLDDQKNVNEIIGTCD